MKGIREYTNARFAEHLPKLADLGNTGFRKAVMEGVVAQFGITVASAATHYNHALKMQRIADPKSVEGLGRPEDKKGGRKAKHLVTVIKVKSGEVVATNLSKGAADLMIAKAEKARKAKLAIQTEAPAEAPAPAAEVAAPVAVTA